MTGPTSAAWQVLPDDLRGFVEAQRWTFAKTMPAWPHEYIVRERVGDDEGFERLIRHIRAAGRAGRFYSRTHTYLEADGWVYWTMGAPVEETVIINRCRPEDTYEAREARGDLPP